MKTTKKGKGLVKEHNTEWGVTIINVQEATEIYRKARAEIKTFRMKELLCDISLGIRAAADSGCNVYKSRVHPLDSETASFLEDAVKTLRSSSVGSYDAKSDDDGRVAWVVVVWDSAE